MLFAAGFGTRMGALTNDIPKPLLKVGGKTLLQRALDIINDANLPETVVNTHYKADQIHQALRGSKVKISHEPNEILETGGGVRNALPLLGDGPVFTFNPDVVWQGPNPLTILQNAWNGQQMDGLLLLIPKNRARSYGGQGDFDLVNSLIIRGKEYVYSGAQIIKPDQLHNIPETSFSLNLLWNRLIQSNTLHGVIYSGDWCDVGSPSGLELANDMLSETCNV